MLVKQLGEAIRSRRKELGITQPHLAELAGVSLNSLYKLERGQSNPTFDLLSSVIDILGMELKLEVRT